MGSAEKLYEVAKALPEEQVAEILDFAEFLLQKRSGPPSSEAASDTESHQKRPLSSYAGILKDSSTCQGDLVEIQRQLRNKKIPNVKPGI
jgi:hypothetical protein